MGVLMVWFAEAASLPWFFIIVLLCTRVIAVLTDSALCMMFNVVTVGIIASYS